MLASADPAARPIIDPGYFSEEADLDVLVAGVRMARDIAAYEPLASITAGEIMPGAAVTDDEQIREWIRSTSGTMFHPTGTCAMGGNADAVCDPELRVRGVEGLRVVDASVMPMTPRGNTNAPTIAIAERAADLIRGNTPLSARAGERELVWLSGTPSASRRYSTGEVPYATRNARLKWAAFIKPQRAAISLTGISASAGSSRSRRHRSNRRSLIKPATLACSLSNSL